MNEPKPTGQAFLDGYYTSGHGSGWRSEMVTITGTQRAICPDLLAIRDIGEADGWRGHVVRAFFRVMRVVTGL